MATDSMVTVEETPEERRAKLGSLSSGRVEFFEEDAAQAAPVGGEEASAAALKSLLEMESEDKLVRAGKFSKAKWKMQVWIKSDRSIHKPITFTLSFWASGKRLHGGGDESAFVCRRDPRAPKPAAPPFFAMGGGQFKAVASPDGCDGIIPGEFYANGKIVCPHCGMKWDTEHIADSLFYRVPVEKAATILTDWFIRLESQCDVAVKFRPEDIRVKMQALEYGIQQAQRLKGLMVYPLSHIIAETSAGASLESRFKAMLLA